VKKRKDVRKKERGRGKGERKSGGEECGGDLSEMFVSFPNKNRVFQKGDGKSIKVWSSWALCGGSPHCTQRKMKISRVHWDL